MIWAISPPSLVSTTQTSNSGSLPLVSDWALRGTYSALTVELPFRAIHISGIYHSIPSHYCFLPGLLLCIMKAINFTLIQHEERHPLICPQFTSLSFKEGSDIHRAEVLMVKVEAPAFTMLTTKTFKLGVFLQMLDMADSWNISVRKVFRCHQVSSTPSPTPVLYSDMETESQKGYEPFMYLQKKWTLFSTCPHMNSSPTPLSKSCHAHLRGEEIEKCPRLQSQDVQVINSNPSLSEPFQGAGLVYSMGFGAK